MLFEWRIEHVGCYIGACGDLVRLRRDYVSNVANLLGGKPYRKGNPGGFREIHQALARAVREQTTVTLTILENQEDKTERNRRKELVKDRRAEMAGCGLRLLSSR